MVFDCGSCLAKYVLCGFNFIIFLAGSGVLAVGIWLAVDKNSFIGLSKIVPNEQLHAIARPGIIEQISYVLIAVGGLMFIVSFLGYCGAIRESQCMLTTYGIFLLVILILEVTAGCLAVIYKGKAEEGTKGILKTTLADYYTKSENGNAITLAWDSLQVSLHCCGVDNYTDYFNSEEWARGEKVIPESCCVLDENSSTTKPLISSCTSSPNDVNSYYKKGCFTEVMNLMMAHLNILIGIAITLGIIEIVGIFLSFCLAKSVDSYSK